MPGRVGAALYKGSPALGKFYIVTDGATHTHSEGYGIFWEEIDKPITALGFTSLWSKFKLNVRRCRSLSRTADVLVHTRFSFTS